MDARSLEARWWGRLLRRWGVAAITIGGVVYVRAGLEGERLRRLLRHEGVHVADQWRWGVLFYLSYFLPLYLGPFTLRAWWEWRAYREDVRDEVERTGRLSAGTRERVVRAFTGRVYLWMWPFPSFMRRLVDREAARAARRLDPSAPRCNA